MQKLQKALIPTAVVYLTIYLILSPKEGLDAGASAISLCLNTVLPSLFPYLICSGYLTKSGFAQVFSRYLSPIMRPLFKVPGCGAIPLILGMVSGYPVGAVCVKDLYLSGNCTKTEAARMLAFCNNSGPLFIISAVGCGFLLSPHIGRLLYISHLFSAVLVGIILSSFAKKPPQEFRALPPKIQGSPSSNLHIIGETMDSAIFSMLKICGFVVFFTVFANSLPKTSFSPYIHSILEITGGIKVLSALSIDNGLKLSLISFFLAFSGVSVMMQIGAIVGDAQLSLKPYFFGKLLQGGLSFVITKILISKLPQASLVFKENAVETAFLPSHSVLLYSLVMLAFALAVLLVWLALSAIRRKA